jgi:hypothetical protein
MSDNGELRDLLEDTVQTLAIVVDLSHQLILEGEADLGASLLGLCDQALAQVQGRLRETQ